MQAFYAKYGAQVGVIGIDATDTIPGVALREAIARGVTFPLLADLDGSLEGSDLSVHAVPRTFALDAEGHLHFLQAGGMQSAAQIVELLAARAGIAVGGRSGRLSHSSDALRTAR